MQPACAWEIDRNDYEVEIPSQEACDYSIDFIRHLIIHKCLCAADEQRMGGQEGRRQEWMLCSEWLELIATGNQDVALETNPNQMNPFKNSSIGFLRATLLREGTISFDFLVACIR